MAGIIVVIECKNEMGKHSSQTKLNSQKFCTLLKTLKCSINEPTPYRARENKGGLPIAWSCLKLSLDGKIRTTARIIPMKIFR